jgi:O-antigen/teichoic acid export membrane protein
LKELNLGRNTAVTVVNKVAGIIIGIFTVRFLVLGLSSNDYGFYVFIWKISSTIFLADFGLGLAAQKKATQYLSSKNSSALNEDLSSIMYFYIVVFILFTVVNYFFISPSLNSFFKIENKIKPLHYYQNIFFVATTIIAFNFSISFFKEILAGLHKLYISEFLFLVNKILVFFGILIFYWTNSSLKFICFIVPLIQTFTLLLMAKVCFGSIKDLKLLPSNVSIQNLKETFKYSMHFYIQSLMVIVNNNIAHIVIGTTIGSVTVGMYQIAMKAQEIMLNLNEFYQKNILPSTSYLHHQKRTKELKTLILSSNKLIFFTATVSFFIFYLMCEPLLYIWLEVDNTTIFLTAKMLILETYFKMVLSSVNRNYLIMSDDEKVMSKYAFFEILGNSLAAIFIIKIYGIVHYAFFKAMLTFVVHYMGAKRLTLKKLKISIWEYVCHCYLRTILSLPFPVGLLLYLTYNLKLEEWTLVRFITISFSYGFVFLLIGLVIVLSKKEKKILREKFPKLKFLFYSF